MSARYGFGVEELHLEPNRDPGAPPHSRLVRASGVMIDTEAEHPAIRFEISFVTEKPLDLKPSEWSRWLARRIGNNTLDWLGDSIGHPPSGPGV